MVGRTLDDLYPRGPRAVGEPLLQVEGLAPDRLVPASFTLHRGEILGIAGLLGAGRTRLLRGLFGLDAVRSGSVKLGVHTRPSRPGRLVAATAWACSAKIGPAKGSRRT